MQHRGTVARGQGIASGWVVENAAVFEAALGTRIYPGTINVRLDGQLGHRMQNLSPSGFNLAEPAWWIDCTVNDVQGFIMSVEYPAPSFREGRDGKSYIDKTMLEVICVSKLPGIAYGSPVVLDADLSSLSS